MARERRLAHLYERSVPRRPARRHGGVLRARPGRADAPALGTVAQHGHTDLCGAGYTDFHTHTDLYGDGYTDFHAHTDGDADLHTYQHAHPTCAGGLYQWPRVARYMRRDRSGMDRPGRVAGGLHGRWQ